MKVFDKRILIGLALVVVTLVGSIGIAVYNIGKLHDDAQLVSHTHEVTGALSGILATVADAETGQRGFIITGEDRYLEPYQSALAALDAHLQRARALTTDNPRQQSRLAPLEASIDERLRLLKSNIDVRRTLGIDDVRDRILSDAGKLAMDSIRRQIAVMLAEESQLMRERTARYTERFRTAVVTGLVSAGLGLAMVVVFANLLNRSLRARSKAAEAIHREREQLRVTLASIGDGVIATDVAGNVTMLNPIAEALTGWPQADAAGQSLERVFHIVNETTRASVDNPALRALREGAIVGLANHTVLISRTGSEKAIADSAAPIRDLAGNVLGAVLVFRDVAEERAAERALEESEARKSAILQTALDAIITCDHEGRVVEFNPAAERTFGYRAAEVLGHDLGELIVPLNMRERHRLGMLRYLETGDGPVLNRRLELTALRSDDEEFPVELAITPIHADGPPFFTAHIRDISQRKAAERALDDRVRLLSLTADISRALTHGDTLPTMLHGCAEALIRHLHGALARIWTFDERTQTLELAASAGPVARQGQTQQRVPLGEGKVGLIAATREPRLTNAVVDDPLIPDQEWVRTEGLVSFAGYPLVVGDRLVGVMSMFSREPLAPHTLDTMADVGRDVALGIDRERAVREVSDGRRLLQVTLAGIGDAVLTTDSAGRVTYLNPVAERLTGWTNAEACGRTTEEVFHIVNETTERPVESPVRRVLAEGVIVGLANHTVLIAKDGARRPIDDSGAPIRDDDGKLVGTVLVFRDVAERRKSERRLRDISTRLNAALDAGAIGTWVWDIVADKTYGDDNLAQMFRMSPADAAGAAQNSFLAAIHPFDREVVAEQVRHAIETGTKYECEFRIPQPDGSIRWYVGRGSVETDDDGRAVRMPGVVVDITDRKQAEQEIFDLTEASERDRRLYETILGAVPDFVYVFDLQHRFTYVNKALLEMWGKTYEESVGRTCLELGYEPWHAKMHDDEIDHVAATKTPIRNEVPFTGTSGKRIYDYIFFPVFAADGSVEAVAGTTRDITDRKQLEEHLRTVAAELSEANRRKTEFLATLAHELRNPLAPIRTGLELLKIVKDDPVVLEDTRGMMERQTLHMVRLIDDLLEISRISQGKLQLRMVSVDVADVVRTSVEAVRPLMDEARHQFHVELPAEPLWLHADPNRLSQVISNLLNNAAKYTRDGGSIRLEVGSDGDHVLITVTDNGLGIPTEMLSRIFDMFTQIDRPLEQGYTGLGIGLTLVKQLVEMHQGTVGVESAGVDQGSRFFIRLPIAQPGTPPKNDAAVPAVPEGTSGHRVLVVDDNRPAAESLATVLKVFGNEVRVAHDGLAAVQAAAEFRPQLVLMDLGMPRLSGYEAAQRIRREPWGRAMVLAALTGWGQAEDRRRTQEAGFNYHLTKPAEPAELLRLLAGIERNPDDGPAQSKGDGV